MTSADLRAFARVRTHIAISGKFGQSVWKLVR
jgi:hypothetical protein